MCKFACSSLTNIVIKKKNSDFCTMHLKFFLSFFILLFHYFPYFTLISGEEP